MTRPPLPAPPSHLSAYAGHQPRAPEDRDPPDSRHSAVMRRFRVTSLAGDGTPHVTDRVGPSVPLFDAAFSAFARGTLIKTSSGQVAVEDLVPGCELVTREFGPMPLLWVGSLVISPPPDDVAGSGPRLTRIMADSLGLERPSEDLIAGPGMRLLTRPDANQDIIGADQILAPADHLVDGVQIISVTPQRPLRLYHLCLHRHATITAAGLWAETFHPGPGFERAMGPDMLSLFLSFFPHVHAPGDFGRLAYPRMPVAGGDPQARP